MLQYIYIHELCVLSEVVIDAFLNKQDIRKRCNRTNILSDWQLKQMFITEHFGEQCMIEIDSKGQKPSTPLLKLVLL